MIENKMCGSCNGTEIQECKVILADGTIIVDQYWCADCGVTMPLDELEDVEE